MKQTAVEFAFARPEDERAIKSLLSERGLPHEDISEQLRDFIVVKNGGEVVGVVGLEVLGEVGLLRSLAVASSYRGKGLAKTLCNKMEGYASSQGIKTLYLLTLTAEGFFKKLNYRRLERIEVPNPIQNTKEFSTICPATAVCMVKDLETNLAIGVHSWKHTGR